MTANVSLPTCALYRLPLAIHKHWIQGELLRTIKPSWKMIKNCQRSFNMIRRLLCFIFLHTRNLRQRQRSLALGLTLTHCVLSVEDLFCSGPLFRSNHSMTNDWGMGWSDNNVQERCTQLTLAAALNDRTERPMKQNRLRISSEENVRVFFYFLFYMYLWKKNLLYCKRHMLFWE